MTSTTSRSDRFRLLASGLVITSLGLAGCQPPAEQGPPPAEPTGTNPTVEATPVDYACESGEALKIAYGEEVAVVTYKGQDVALRRVVSASGAKYQGGGLEWFGAVRDGVDSGILSRINPAPAAGEDPAGVVLERCSRPVPGASPVPSPSAGPIQAGQPCAGPQLRMERVSSDAGAGNRYATLSLQNISSQACYLTGYPGLTLMNATGQNLVGVRADQERGPYLAQDAEPPRVTLAPQSKAYFDLAWNVVPREDQGQTQCPEAARVRATSPGDTSAITVDMPLTPCGGRVRVGPVRAEQEPSVANGDATPVPTPGAPSTPAPKASPARARSGSANTA